MFEAKIRLVAWSTARAVWLPGLLAMLLPAAAHATAPVPPLMIEDTATPFAVALRVDRTQVGGVRLDATVARAGERGDGALHSLTVPAGDGPVVTVSLPASLFAGLTSGYYRVLLSAQGARLRHPVDRPFAHRRFVYVSIQGGARARVTEDAYSTATDPLIAGQRPDLSSAGEQRGGSVSRPRPSGAHPAAATCVPTPSRFQVVRATERGRS